MTFNIQYIEPFLIILEIEHHILSPLQALPTSQSLSLLDEVRGEAVKGELPLTEGKRQAFILIL